LKRKSLHDPFKDATCNPFPCRTKSWFGKPLPTEAESYGYCVQSNVPWPAIAANKNKPKQFGEPTTPAKPPRIGKGANVADLILRDVDPEELRAAIVADVLNGIRPLLTRSQVNASPIATRDEMRGILRWSMGKLDAATKAKTIPSIMEGDRRTYVIADVLDALRAGTPAAEADAAARQAAKQAKRQAAKGDRS
jgi:hypothetical protein